MLRVVGQGSVGESRSRALAELFVDGCGCQWGIGRCTGRGRQSRTDAELKVNFGSRNLEVCGGSTVVFSMPDHRYNEFTSAIAKFSCLLINGRKKAEKLSIHNTPRVP